MEVRTSEMPAASPPLVDRTGGIHARRRRPPTRSKRMQARVHRQGPRANERRARTHRRCTRPGEMGARKSGMCVRKSGMDEGERTIVHLVRTVRLVREIPLDVVPRMAERA